MVAKLALQPVTVKIAILVIVQLIAIWVNGVTGARAPQLAAVVTDPALAILLPLLLMVAVLAIIVMIPPLATLSTVQWIAMWVNGPLGLRAPRPAVVVLNIALVQSLPVPVMVAKIALQPVTL
jgi:hypothetical protein